MLWLKYCSILQPAPFHQQARMHVTESVFDSQVSAETTENQARALSFIHPAGRMIKGLSWCFLRRKHELKLFLLLLLLCFVLFSTERLQSNKCNTAE